MTFASTAKHKNNFKSRQSDKVFICQSNKNIHEKGNIFIYLFSSQVFFAKMING